MYSLTAVIMQPTVHMKGWCAGHCRSSSCRVIQDLAWNATNKRDGLLLVRLLVLLVLNLNPAHLSSSTKTQTMRSTNSLDLNSILLILLIKLAS